MDKLEIQADYIRNLFPGQGYCFKDALVEAGINPPDSTGEWLTKKQVIELCKELGLTYHTKTVRVQSDRNYIIGYTTSKISGLPLPIGHYKYIEGEDLLKNSKKWNIKILIET